MTEQQTTAAKPPGQIACEAFGESWASCGLVRRTWWTAAAEAVAAPLRAERDEAKRELAEIRELAHNVNDVRAIDQASARIGELEAQLSVALGERDYTRSEFQLLCADHDHLSAERNQLVARLATAVHGLRAITHGAPAAAEAREIAERAIADACAGLDT